MIPAALSLWETGGLPKNEEMNSNFEGRLHMDTILIDFDDLLIGRIQNIDPANFYGTEPGGPNEKKALSCIKYAIIKILMWTPEDAVARFDEYIIQILHLDKIISYISFPIEVPYGNPRYILSLLYPDRIRLNPQKLVEELFESVLSAARKKALVATKPGEEQHIQQFPREYFSGTDGFKRFCGCVKYIIENYKPMSSVDEVYMFFLSPQGQKLLYDFRLKIPADQFSIDMLHVIHYITREDPDSDLYYSYFSFLEETKKLKVK